MNSRFTAAVWLLALLVPSSASAQVRDCRGSPNDVAPKMYIDSIGVDPNPPGPLLKRFGKGVHDRLRQRLESIAHELADEGVVGCYYCERRRPAGPGSFPFNMQEKLATEKVVLLELWSRVDSTMSDDRVPIVHGKVEWALFPLCVTQDLNWANRGFFVRDWESSLSNAPSVLDSLIVSRDTLLGYAIVALALSELQAKEYQHAFALLLRARETLPEGDPDLGVHFDDLIHLISQRAQADHVTLPALFLGEP